MQMGLMKFKVEWVILAEASYSLEFERICVATSATFTYSKNPEAYISLFLQKQKLEVKWSKLVMWYISWVIAFYFFLFYFYNQAFLIQ